MLNQDNLKKLAGEYALKYVKEDMVLGIGTGSTVKCFIENLAYHKIKVKEIISSSLNTTKLLQEYGFQVSDLNNVGRVDLYIDGADEVNYQLQLIKGGGGALTREKIIAAASYKFICLADHSKYVMKLGNFPLPLEVIPMARSYVAREIIKLGGMPNWRNGVITDNGNVILDIYNLDINKPIELEEKLNNIAGVVTNGLFAKRSADELVLAQKDGSITIINPNVR